MKQATIYAFKPWARLSGDPQRVGKTLERMREKHHTLAPHLIVEAARDKDTPEGAVLHDYFEWDDDVAAQAHRCTQAAHLLRSIVIVKTAGMDIDTPVRAFVAIRNASEDANDADAGNYTSIVEAIRIEDYRARLMQDAMRDLDAYRNRYAALNDLIGWDRGLQRAKRELERSLAQCETEQAA